RQLALLAAGLEGLGQVAPEIFPLALQLEWIVEDPDRVLGEVFGDRLEAARVEAGEDSAQPGREQFIVADAPARGLRPGAAVALPRMRAELVDQLAELPAGRLDGVGRGAHGGDGRLA